MDDINGKRNVNGEDNDEDNDENINDLFINESDEFESDKSNKNLNFSSSDSDKQIVNRNKSKTIRKKIEKNKTESDGTNAANGINATNGIAVIDNISSNKNLDLDDSENSPDSNKANSSDNKSSSSDSAHKNVTSMVEHMLKPNNVNGWDNEANTTIKNWYHTFKQQSFVYQWVLDHNNLMSERLAIASIITSSVLGIFAGFKLWIPDGVFQTTSDVILVLCNFCVALITAMSRRYGDDKRTDSIRDYVNDIDEFLGEISAQVLKSPIYRMDADEFFKANNDKYTKLIMCAPNMSLDEINQAKKLYQVYIQQVDNIPV